MIYRHIKVQLPDVQEARLVVVGRLPVPDSDVEELDRPVVVADNDPRFDRALMRAREAHRGEHDGIVDRAVLEDIFALP